MGGDPSMERVNTKNQYGSTSSSDSSVTNEQSSKRTQLAQLSSRLLLIGTTITNFNKSDEALILAGIINLIAGLLSQRAAVLEAEEQQIAPGVTTFANNLKLIGTAAGLIVSLILFWALLIEVEIRSGTSEIGAQSPIAGATGSLFL
jgi:hypothetical protein